MYTKHNFLIHSSADGHLGCFHVLTIAKSAAMDIGVCMSLSTLVSSEYMSSSMAVLVPVFKGISTLFSTVVVPVCIPTNSIRGGSLFSKPSLAVIVRRLIDDEHSDQCEMVPHCGFDLPFTNNA